jgi:signal transduction histidine kinase
VCRTTSAGHSAASPERPGWRRNLWAENQSDKAAQFLQIIATQAETTGQLVDSLLALARASDANLSRQPIDMNALAAEVISSMHRGRPVALLPIFVGPLVEIVADRKLVRQVLINLIGNALKFASEVPQPEIHVGMLGAREAQVFFVRDNGVGFDAEKAHRLFKPFHRLHGTRFEGSGIGLSIVKRIVDRHGGTLWAESVPGPRRHVLLQLRYCHSFLDGVLSLKDKHGASTTSASTERFVGR